MECVIADMMREMTRSGLFQVSAVKISFKVANVKTLLTNRQFGAALALALAAEPARAG